MDFQVAQDIAADIGAERLWLRDKAFSSEQSDLLAARQLRETLADGKITADEIPALRSALRHVESSARHDHDLAEQLTHD